MDRTVEQASVEQTSVQREVRIDATPETVWGFLIDPEKIRRWKGIAVSFDPRPEEPYRIEVLPGHVASGQVVEVDPPRRLVITWGWEPSEGAANVVPPGSSTLEYVLIPDGDGTLLRFTHRDLPNAASCESHAQGWDHYFARLGVAAAGGDPGRDPWLGPWAASKARGDGSRLGAQRGTSLT
jgi:uncharacterized protein YndB with AHSA1/START domain